MTPKRINEVIVKTIGEEAIPVVNMLKKTENLSEFVMAKQLGVDIQVVRQILYKLHNLNLAEYKRVKDRKKGWYVGYWTLHMNRFRDLYNDIKRRELEKYRQRLREEQENLNNYYLCRNVCVRMNFDEAAELSFHCPECGSLLHHQHNERTIQVLKERIKELKTYT